MISKMNKIAFTKINIDDILCIKESLSFFPFKPLSYFLGVSLEQIANFWYDDLKNSLSSEDATVIIAQKGDKIIGLALFIKLPWESGILGKNMACIKYLCVDHRESGITDIIGGLIEEVERYGRQRGAQFLLCKTYTKDIPSIHALEIHGFLLMDTLLDFIFDYRKHPIENVSKPKMVEGVSLRLASEFDVEQLVKIANLSFANHFGRFNSDGMIPHKKAVCIYEEWIKSCLQGWADYVIVAEIGKNIAGYSAWKRPSILESKHGMPIGHYSIGGIHPEYSGLGLFYTLTYEGMRRLNGCADMIEGPTHINNYPVQKNYTRLGWNIACARHSFHKWLE